MTATTTKQAAQERGARFYYSFARTQNEIDDSLALRYRVFVQEMGAQATLAGSGLEADAMDAFCLHLLVRDARDGRAVASTRVLTHEAAVAAGGFYSSSEFELDAVLACQGRFLEIGRTCVAEEYRRSPAMAVLWSGIADLIRADRYDHLIGCASIDLRDGLALAHATYRQIWARQPAERHRCVRPRLALPPAEAPLDRAVRLPPLIKAYLRVGACVGGPPCYDPDFNVADVFMHLDLNRLTPRYARHFLGRTMPDDGRSAARMSA
ncbi:GNAT family N-acyltransferase [uncultured Salinisphaera sp.]|uniref:GNAT family N-acetyltransferase n=1 Tax=uncultured Salinisphaera sp. TaxID=359372 RepID=UPI0032B17660